MIRHRVTQWGAVLAILAFATGCAEFQFLSQASKIGGVATQPTDPNLPDLGARYKVGSPYEINGIWYYPKEDYSYVEEGVASWYGPNFHGKQTANGGIFDETLVSAAHRTLPLPSMVRVTNLENGRSIQVVVNDRGPYAHSRIIDLSRRAAQLLDYEVNGTALVRVEVLEAESRQLAASMNGGPAFVQSDVPEPPPPETAPTALVDGEELAPPPGAAEAEERVQVAELPPAEEAPVERPAPDTQTTTGEVTVVAVDADPDVFIQAGAFGQYHNADRARVSLSYLGPIIVQEITRSSTPLFRVRLGPLKEEDNLESLLVAVIQAGYTDAQVIVAQN